MKIDKPPEHLDIEPLAQSGGTIGGHDLLSNYKRLMAESKDVAPDAVLVWQAQGELRVDLSAGAQSWLRLTVQTRLPLTCQRCLNRVDVVVKVDQHFRFVENEQTAQEQDEICEEEVLAISHDLNLAELIEDEVLLALPLIPRHEICPVPVKLAAVDAGFRDAPTEKPNPFAVLDKLRTDRSS